MVSPEAFVKRRSFVKRWAGNSTSALRQAIHIDKARRLEGVVAEHEQALTSQQESQESCRNPRFSILSILRLTTSRMRCSSNLELGMAMGSTSTIIRNVSLPVVLHMAGSSFFLIINAHAHAGAERPQTAGSSRNGHGSNSTSTPDEGSKCISASAPRGASRRVISGR
ncbi:hypothetical protein FIBSPDRAFT_296958 [Athelia psychrophila]|uniref:Uncharacterized protein n=1 Tax=Athelia psychrophila TaxID=1759441 RepID=A0A167X9R6_9AGAM|nr:hypothetical protein FIBSPDRAFT_296958 [Fibularhizoctonia sp. CBS 109695]